MKRPPRAAGAAAGEALAFPKAGLAGERRATGDRSGLPGAARAELWNEGEQGTRRAIADPWHGHEKVLFLAPPFGRLRRRTANRGADVLVEARELFFERLDEPRDGLLKTFARKPFLDSAARFPYAWRKASATMQRALLCFSFVFARLPRPARRSRLATCRPKTSLASAKNAYRPSWPLHLRTHPPHWALCT